MKFYCSIITLSLTLFLTGCATKQTVVCFTPTSSFNPETGKELLSEINAQIPFEIQPEEFICRVKYDRLVGWVLIPDDQKETVKENVESSGTLTLLQVDQASEEFKATLKNWWKSSQTVKVNPEK